MSIAASDRYLGQRLAHCYAELQEAGALRTWAPYHLGIGPVKQIHVRFNNHWGRLAEAESMDYRVTVTDQEGLITFTEVFRLSELASGEVRLSPAPGQPSLGAVYFGCVSPAVVRWCQGEEIVGDYFYLAYESAAGYSLIHAQPIQDYARGTVNCSSAPNCLQVLSSESPTILVGNPSMQPSVGSLQLEDAISGQARPLDASLEPFEVRAFDLTAVPDGWYTLQCNVGKAYSHLLRSTGDSVIVRHL